MLLAAVALYLPAHAQLGEATLLPKKRIGADSVAILPKALGSTSTPQCGRPGACQPSDCIEYVFLGTGTWENAANWRYGLMPPAVIRGCYIIRINPVANTKSIMLQPTTIMAGGQLIVEPGKQFIIPGDLIIYQ